MDSALAVTIIGVGVATIVGIIAVVGVMWTIRGTIVKEAKKTNARLDDLSETVEGFNTRLGNAEATTTNLQRKVDENDNFVKLHHSEINTHRDLMNRILNLVEAIQRDRSV